MKYKVNVIVEGGQFFTKSFRTNLMANLYVNKVLDQYHMTILDCQTNNETVSYLCDGTNRVEIVTL